MIQAGINGNKYDNMNPKTMKRTQISEYGGQKHNKVVIKRGQET